MTHTKKQNTFEMCGHQKYFKLNIHERINARQGRNGLNINYLFSTVIRQSDFNSEYPCVNVGLYHPYGKTHSQYPQN